MLDAYRTTGNSPPRRVTLTHVDLIPGCTVGQGVGLDPDGNEVTFAGDWRALLQCARALDAGRTVEVYLADWQVLAWRRL